MITMNTKNLLLLASLTLAMPLTAQTPQEDFKRDITLSGSNYVAYRGPQKQLTAAPKGRLFKIRIKIWYKKWCYIGVFKLLIFNTLIYKIVL